MLRKGLQGLMPEGNEVLMETKVCPHPATSPSLVLHSLRMLTKFKKQPRRVRRKKKRRKRRVKRTRMKKTKRN